MEQCMLTTVDNPFNPFTNFNEWFNFDVKKGYNTCSLMDRITKVTSNFGPIEEAIEIEKGIDDIVSNLNPFGLYFKIRQGDKITLPLVNISSEKIMNDWIQGTVDTATAMESLPDS